jgi:hypothetical protein
MVGITDMSDSRSPDVWQLIFEQTPVILRAALGILTLGMFTLATMIYKINRDDMAELRRLHREDIMRVYDKIEEIDEKMDQNFRETLRYLNVSQKRDMSQDERH